MRAYFCQVVISPPGIRPVVKCLKPVKKGEKECDEHCPIRVVRIWP